MSPFQLVVTFAVTGSVGNHLQAVQKGGEAGHRGEDLTLQSVAFCHQRLEEGKTDLLVKITRQSNTKA